MSSSELKSLSSAIPVEKIRYDDKGLVPAIIQDYLDGTVLMMAWMNRESLQRTLDTGETWFGVVPGRNFGTRARLLDIFRRYKLFVMTVIVMLC